MKRLRQEVDLRGASDLHTVINGPGVTSHGSDKLTEPQILQARTTHGSSALLAIVR
ncbi:hypothetical protein MMIN_18970 [Mycolicibacter minnesotensis]|nr:hypothetical protein MMIN_18970 [Mycolicibacter minnesotensis]